MAVNMHNELGLALDRCIHSIKHRFPGKTLNYQPVAGGGVSDIELTVDGEPVYWIRDLGYRVKIINASNLREVIPGAIGHTAFETGLFIRRYWDQKPAQTLH